MTINYWTVFGFLGQGLFGMRFILQWIASERKGESIIPVYFWYFSIAGGMLLLIYSIHRQDPVFILGQSVGLGIYIRNLMLVKTQHQ